MDSETSKRRRGANAAAVVAVFALQRAAVGSSMAGFVGEGWGDGNVNGYGWLWGELGTLVLRIRS